MSQLQVVLKDNSHTKPLSSRFQARFVRHKLNAAVDECEDYDAGHLPDVSRHRPESPGLLLLLRPQPRDPVDSAWTDLHRQITLATYKLHDDIADFWCGVDIQQRVREESIEHSPAARPHPSKSPPQAQSRRQFRGMVSLRASLSPHPRARESNKLTCLCALDHTHLVLFGGTNWEDQLVRVQLENLIISVTDNEPGSFRLKIRQDFLFEKDTRVSISVAENRTRDEWLSVLWAQEVEIQGWDAAAFLRPPASYTSTRVVAWIS